MTVRPGDVAGSGRPGRRVLVVLAVVAAAAAVIAISRAGLSGGLEPAAPAPSGTPLQGSVVAYAAGEARLYVLADACTGGGDCRLRLVTSGSEGGTWTEGTLPAGYPGDPDVENWRLTAAGPDDRLTIETATEIATSPDAGRTWQPQRITDGRPIERVPSNQEAFARLCPAPRCRTPAVEFLQPRSGVRSRLAHQPPFPPLAFGVEGSQLWAAGTDPRTKRWAVAASTDDGASWETAALPPFDDEPGLRARVVPVPGEDEAFLILGLPTDPGGESVYGVWSVPNPSTRVAPRPVLPDRDTLLVDSAVASIDGHLVLGYPAPVEQVVRLAADGAVEAPTVSDPDEPVPQYRSVGRGLRNQVAAVVADENPTIGLAFSDTGAPADWRVVRIHLPG